MKLHIENLLPENYVPKGQISHLPLPIINLMLNEQKWQGNSVSVKLFEIRRNIDKHQGGFNWRQSCIFGSKFNEEIKLNIWNIIVNQKNNSSKRNNVLNELLELIGFNIIDTIFII